MTALVRVATNAGVATLKLDRAPSRNALSLDLIAALHAQLEELATDKTVRVIVIAAEPPAFSSGHDLKELSAHRTDQDQGRAFFDQTFEECSALMLRIVSLPQPVIAAVEGIATAAGCQLVATCDLAIAGAGARFGTPGVNIGLFCTTPAVALSRVAAPKHAMEMLLTGDLIDAESAQRIGLVNRVVPTGEALAAAQTLAQTIARKSPSALRFGKRAFYEQRALPLPQAYEHASRVMTENLLAPDAAEGIAAFLEKRPPHWPDSE